MIFRGEVELHVECFSEGLEEAGDEFRTTVRGDVFGNTVLGKHVHNEKNGEVFGGAMNGGWNEYALFREAVYNY